MRVRFQLKYVWYVFLAILGVLSFFGLWNPPKTWETFLNSIAPIELWWAAHFAHPLLAAFVGGLLFSTVLLPEILRLVRRYMFPEMPRPDVDGAALFNEVFAKSRRAKELVNTKLLKTPLRYESHLTELGIIEGRLRIQLVDEFHDLLRSGSITAWGTPDNRKPHQQIKPEEWSDIELDVNERDLESSPPQLHATYRGKNHRGRAYAYVWLRFSRGEVLREFPLAWFPRTMSDGPKEKP